MPRGRSYRNMGFVRVQVYLDPSVYTALVLKSKRERRDVSSIINELLREGLRREVEELAKAQPAGRLEQRVAGRQDQGLAGMPAIVSQATPGGGSTSEASDLFGDNPWVRVLRDKYGVQS